MENEKIRTSRASQTRDKIEVKKVWTPPNSLDAPPAPTGYRHQWIRSEILGTYPLMSVTSWIRVESMGFQDTKNVAGRIRSGYEL